MKKLFVMLATLMMLLLVACGDATQTVASSASRSMVDSLSGTYVGKNGSALTLFPDGTSEYYYMLYSSMDIDKGAGSWNYKDGTLTWMYHDKPVTAVINEQSALSFTLAQTDEWNREQFIKASDIAKNRTVDEYQELLRNTLNRPEMDNYDSALNQIYKIGSYEIEIPFYFFDYKNDDDNAAFFAENTQDDGAFLLVEGSGDDVFVGVSNADFEKKGVEVWEALVDSIDSIENLKIIQEPSKTEINGLPGVKGTFAYDYEGIMIQSETTIVFDEKSDSILVLELWTTDGTVFKYDSDYSKIVNSVTATGSSVASSSSSASNGDGRAESSSTTASSNGVTPELKAFLDSYEAYMDQYIAFMKKYESSNDTYSMLYDYLDIMKQYSEFTRKLVQYDTDKMSATDSAYYLEVTTHVAKKLYEAAIQ